MKSFVLFMVLYPDVQQRAQAEIDEVVGRDRLPSPDDGPNLPYVSAVIKEVLRYAPVVPLGKPFALSQGHFTAADSRAQGSHIGR